MLASVSPLPERGPILLAYDDSPAARAAVERSAELWPGARVTVLTIWQSARDMAGAGLAALPSGVVHDALDELDSSAERGAREIAGAGAELAGERGLAAEARTASAERNVWAAIEHVAEELGAPAIVVGSRGHGELHELLLGSTSTGLVHHARRPVMVVRVRGEGGEG